MVWYYLLWVLAISEGFALSQYNLVLSVGPG
jgi:hypothetical protein